MSGCMSVMSRKACWVEDKDGYEVKLVKDHSPTTFGILIASNRVIGEVSCTICNIWWVRFLSRYRVSPKIK
jgi:hypothetical protein